VSDVETEAMQIILKGVLGTELNCVASEFIFWDLTTFGSLEVRRRFGSTKRKPSNERTGCYYIPRDSSLDGTGSCFSWVKRRVVRSIRAENDLKLFITTQIVLFMYDLFNDAESNSDYSVAG
jgi:hypothetical protein